MKIPLKEKALKSLNLSAFDTSTRAQNKIAYMHI
ncbi:MAG TPA: hypothetical protein DHV48_05065 [Prolixibacteraceae bacterium]|nr:hypothetical protein [Prolixibacteraceae bacterium]